MRKIQFLLLLLMLLTKLNSFGQMIAIIDSSKFGVSIGTLSFPLLNMDNFPPYVELSYYPNYKTSIDFAVGTILDKQYSNITFPSTPSDFNYALNISFCKHLMITNWLSLIGGFTATYQYDKLTSAEYTAKQYIYGVGITVAMEIKIYKELSFFTQTDLFYGPNVEVNYKDGLEANHFYQNQFNSFRSLGTGLRLRF